MKLREQNRRLRIKSLDEDIDKLIKSQPPIPVVGKQDQAVEAITLLTGSEIENDPVLNEQLRRFGMRPFGEPDSEDSDEASTAAVR